jgi:hypothetical protein
MGSDMKRISWLGLMIVAVSATAAAGSIDVGAPLLAGDVVSYENGREIGHRTLSPEPLEQVNHWLEKHRSGWQGMLTEATTEPISLRVDLNHGDGRVTSLTFVVHNGVRYLRLTGPGTWAYRSFAGLFKFWAATRSLSARELGELKQTVGAT